MVAVNPEGGHGYSARNSHPQHHSTHCSPHVARIIKVNLLGAHSSYNRGVQVRNGLFTYSGHSNSIV